MTVNVPEPYARPVQAPSRPGHAPLMVGCLIALGAAVIAIALGVLLTGVAIGRIGSWFDLNPFGMFAEPQTRIDDRRTAVVTRMQAMARLETMTFTIEKVIEAEKSGNALSNVLFGDRILLIAHGEVVAGVDLGDLQPSSVIFGEDDSVTVALPASEIFHSRLDNEQTRIYDRDRGLLSRGDSQLETRARQSAENAILEAACGQGILERAASEASTQVEGLLRLLEFSRVTVTAPVGTCPIPP